jgi:hypothetical protein
MFSAKLDFRLNNEHALGINLTTGGVRVGTLLTNQTTV